MIRAENIVKKYIVGETEIRALDGMDFTVEEGQFAVILGPSGAGKTTLLNLIGGMDTLTSGKLIVGGRDIGGFTRRQLTEYRRNSVGFVFQFYNLMPNLTALENAELATEMCKGAFSPEEMLRQVGLGCILVQAVLSYLDFGSLADAEWYSYIASFALVLVFAGGGPICCSVRRYSASIWRPRSKRTIDFQRSFSRKTDTAALKNAGGRGGLFLMEKIKKKFVVMLDITPKE